MLDHIGLYCRDASVTLLFYRACLAPLGIIVFQEQPHFKAAIFGRPGSPIFDGFYAAAIAAGGVDNGPPGYRRPTCTPPSIDPDGANVEAVWPTERVAATTP